MKNCALSATIRCAISHSKFWQPGPFPRRAHTYDNNGNIISDGIRTFEYNQSDRLVKVKLGVTVIAEYFYSGFGQRIKKVASGTTIHYHYDL
jgi:hypothetical protein